MKFILFVFFMVTPSISFAQNSLCPDRLERRGSIQVQQVTSNQNGRCYLSINNFKLIGMVYRSYLFSSDGDFMVFNSFGDGPQSQDTGAREFFLFPRPLAQPSFSWNDDTRRLEVTSVSGSKFYFDYENAQISSFDHGQVRLDPEITKLNHGGVEVSKYQGLMLDAGFTLGNAPSDTATAFSILTDKRGATCKVKNAEVFKYSNSGDVTCKYSDKGLSHFLKARCPQLRF